MSLSQPTSSKNVGGIPEKEMEALPPPPSNDFRTGDCQRSAPSSPCVARRPHSLNVDSKIPQSLALSTPLRRSGSLRLRGEKLAVPSSRGRNGLGSRPSPGGFFPSITEAAESWKRSLRGAGDAPNPPTSALRQQRHHRSLGKQSLSTRTTSSRDTYPHTPTPSPEDLELLHSQNLNRFLLDHAKEFSGDRDDLDSLRSYDSNCSTQSACDHAQFARNGTTFSGRRMKYIVHCSSHPEPNEYLTPTQRANQQIRRLKALVEQAHKDLQAKDESIFKLTKEVVELRLLREEVDGSPSKTSESFKDSPLQRAANQLEIDPGNSTSLSDSGHFDDAFSSASAQSTHNPSPRRIAHTSESEHLADVYQHKIDEATRKHSEKSLEDRKNLVEMYEKKMEEMSRRAREKFQQERDELIDMYEKKIGDIIKKDQEKLQEEKISLQNLYEKKLDVLSHELAEHASSCYHESDQNLSKKLEDTQQMLNSAEQKMKLLTQQLEDVNAKYNDLQQEHFLVQERNVNLEEELESMKRTVAVLEDQLSNEQTAIVDTVKLETELEILRRHVEEHKDVSQLNLQLQSELARVLQNLKDEQTKCKILEERVCDSERLLEAKQSEASELVSKLEAKLSTVQSCLREAEENIRDLECKQSLLEEKSLHAMDLKCKLETELSSSSECFKECEQQNAQLRSIKSELEALLADEQKKADDLKCHFESKLSRALEEGQNLWAEEKESLTKSLREKENECLLLVKLKEELEQDVADARQLLIVKDKEMSELLNSKLEVQNQLEKYKKKVQTLETNVESLEKELLGLKTSLSEEKSQSQDLESCMIRDLKEKLNQCCFEKNENILVIQNLKGQLVDTNKHISSLSDLLTKEEEKNKELLQWKLKAEDLEGEVQILKEELDSNRKLSQNVSCLESEVMKLKESLTKQTETIQELLSWKYKASDLENELTVLKAEISEQTQKMLLVNELSESINREVFELPLKQSVSQVEFSPSDPQSPSQEYQQQIIQLEAELKRVKESLDQSYWSLSEKETARLEMEKQVSQQTVKLHTLESQFEALSQSYANLKNENEELRQKHIEIVSHISSEGTNRVTAYNGETSANPTDDVCKLKMEIESLQKALAEQEEKHSEINLKMYLKGQEAAKFERKDKVLEIAAQAPEKVSVPELLSQLAETEDELQKVKGNEFDNKPKSNMNLLSANEAVCLYLLGSFKAMYRQLAEGQANSSSSPEATLLFLKSAFYYFLTDEANCQGHLHAIQSILGFTESEKQAIDSMTYIRR